jgi:DivIVA domain-containing protein
VDLAGFDTRHQPAHPAPLLTAQDVHQIAFHQPRPGQPGYDEDQVDELLDRVEATLRSEDDLTAEQVHQVRFNQAEPDRPGYDAHEVDVFLDLVADTLRSTPQPRQAVAPAQGAHATSTKLKPAFGLSPADVRGVRFHKPRPGNRGYHEGEIDAFLERIEATLRGEDDLTAMEIQEAEFSPAPPGQFGYDQDDVDTFLDLVVVTLERTPPKPVRVKASTPPLTATDVRTVSFGKPPRGRRGYQEAQVDRFLDRVEETLLGRDDLTARDVREVKFSRPLIGRRGYDEDQVDAFLSRVEQQLADGLARRIPRITTWKELRQLKLPQASGAQRGYRVAQVDRLLEEIGIALDGMLGATSDEVTRAKLTQSLLAGQGYDRAFVDELLPELAAELRKRGR